MADIYDQDGNPIQLTDELGRPVQLTDERGRPIHLTGVAGVDSAPHDSTTIGSDPMLHNRKTHLNHTIPDAMPGGAGGVEHAVQRPESSRTTIGSEFKMHDHGTQLNPTIPGGAGLGTAAMIGGAGGETAVIGGAGSCSSSEEDDGEGGRRRKKKGLMQKIKEKLPGQKNKEEKAPEMVYTATTKISVTTPAGQLPGEPKTEYIRVEHHEEEHAKKGLMDKIKDKLPGHHSH